MNDGENPGNGAEELLEESTNGADSGLEKHLDDLGTVVAPEVNDEVRNNENEMVMATVEHATLLGLDPLGGMRAERTEPMVAGAELDGGDVAVGAELATSRNGPGAAIAHADEVLEGVRIECVGRGVPELIRAKDRLER